MATIEDLEGDKGRLEAEIEAVRSKVQSELDEVDFRLGVQAKAIAGLEGFKRKLESDLEFVEGKLDAIRHVRAELEEHMRRLTEVLQGLNNKTEAERRALDRLTDDFNQLKADREAQMRREEQERDQMHSQVYVIDREMQSCIPGLMTRDTGWLGGCSWRQRKRCGLVWRSTSRSSPRSWTLSAGNLQASARSSKPSKSTATRSADAVWIPADSCPFLSKLCSGVDVPGPSDTRTGLWDCAVRNRLPSQSCDDSRCDVGGGGHSWSTRWTRTRRTARRSRKALPSSSSKSVSLQTTSRLFPPPPHRPTPILVYSYLRTVLLRLIEPEWDCTSFLSFRTALCWFFWLSFLGGESAGGNVWCRRSK
jgi:hypothetical protein